MQVSEAFACLAREPRAVMLVVNRRLQRRLLQAYAHQQGGAAGVVTRPSLGSFEDWLDAHTEAGIQAGQWPLEALPDHVLSADDELNLWESIIADHDDSGLLSARDLAAEAQRAHALLCEYGALPATAVQGEETRAFLRWRGLFRGRCAARQWLAEADWRQRQIERLDPARLPPVLLLHGFDDHRPWLKTLITAVEAAGGRVHRLAHGPAAPRQLRLQPADVDAETDWVARACRQHLATHPEARIGIVVPDLQARALRLSEALCDELEPLRGLGFDTGPSAELNLSLGQPLAAQPLVQTALRLLALVAQPAPWVLRQLSPLWLCPWLVGDAEAGALARLEANWRRQDRVNLSSAAVEEGLRSLGADSAFATRWRALMAAVAALPRRAPLRDWSLHLHQLLDAAGWPARAALDSVDWQIRNAFLETLAELGKARWPEGDCRLVDAVRALSQRCQRRVFQAEQPGTARVQVCGLLEAAGLEVDQLWVLDLRDTVLPAPLKPNALLPQRWQKEQGLPHASHARERHLAAQIIARLAASAGEVFWSCPAHEGDAALRISPLLASLPITGEVFAPASAALLHSLPRQIPETLLADPAPPLHPQERLHGGSRLPGLQAINPQAAFVEGRLQAAPVGDLPEPGLSRERGRLVHLALQQLWQGLQSLAALQDCDPATLQAACENAAEFALGSRETALRCPWPAQWRALEKQVLTTLLAEWLAFERGRGQPFTATSLETELRLQLGALALDLRVDRLDTLADGRQVVIDYKTGASWKTPDWFSARPRDPQLMLYALALDAPLAAVVAGRVRAGAMQVKGLSDDDSVLPGLAVDRRFTDADSDTRTLDTLRTHWHARLLALAEAFARGEAENCSHHPQEAEQLPSAPFLRLWHDPETAPDPESLAE